MKRLFKLFVVLVALAGWPLAFSALHVVRTPDPAPVIGNWKPEWGTVHVVTKDTLGFHQTFADTRHWTLNDIADHTALAARLDRAGLSGAYTHAGPPEDVAAALRGEKKDPPPIAPAVDPFAGEPPVPPTVQAKPVELVKPPLPTKAAPTTQPKQPSVFDF